MAFAMTTQGPSSITARMPADTPFPGNTAQIADQTFTTTAVTTSPVALAVPGNWFRVVVYLKALTLGANTGATSGPVFYVKVADNSGLTTNLTIIGPIQQAANIASNTAVQCFVWTARVPVAGKAYVAITCDPSPMGTGSS